MESADTEALRNAAASWTLAGDKQLLDVLQNIHQRLVTRCQETNKKLDDMVSALDDASIRLQNVNNKFMALSNTQFIESRVYDDDVDIAPPPETKIIPQESPKPLDPTSELDRLKMGLRTLEAMHEELQILQDSDSDIDSDEDEISRLVLKPKDLYADRPLPYIIGSDAWKSKWHAGLIVEDSDTDSSTNKQTYDDEYSHSEPEVEVEVEGRTDGHTAERTVSTTSSDMPSEQDTPTPRPTPADVAAEVARRLAGHLPIPIEKPTEQDTEYAPAPAHPVRKVYGMDKPATSTIFSDEPPPLDQSYESDRDEYSQEEDDDIFAELRKKPYAPNNRDQSRVTDDLFGNLGVANDIEPNSIGKKVEDASFNDFKEQPSAKAANKIQLFSDESEPELFADKSVNKSADKLDGSTSESVKKPVGGISLFGKQGTESIGAAILKRNRIQTSPSEDAANEETPSTNSQQNKKEKDIFDDLFAKSAKEQKKVGKNAEKEVTFKESKVNKVDLFSDNLFDDIDDIFTSNVVKVPKESNKNKMSLFDDDDDLFSEVATTKTVKNTSGNKKSIFDSDDDLFIDNKVKKLPDTQTSNVVIEPKTREVNKPNKSIFDDSSDSDIFIDENSKKSIEVEAHNMKDDTKIISDILKRDVNSKTEDKINEKEIDEELKSKSLSENKKEIAMPKLMASAKSSLLLEDNDDDDLFKVETSVKTTNLGINTNKYISHTAQSTSEVENISINNDQIKKTETKSLFDNQGDDLFKEPKQKDENGESERPLFENNSEDDLFTDKNIKSKLNSEFTEHHKPNDNTFLDIVDVKDELFDQNESDKKLLFSNQSVKDRDSTELNKNDKTHISDEFNTEIFTDGKLKNNKSNENTSKEGDTEAINKKSHSVFDEDFDEDLFSNKYAQNLKSDEVQFIEPASNIQESSLKDKIDVNIEDIDAKSSKLNINSTNTDDNRLKDAVFSEPSEMIYEPDVIDKEKSTVVPEAKESDVFSELFSEPPEFEKPKEPKKSKNINALFDDDSDDEALFFKKNDPVFDDKPEFTSPSSDSRLFGLFHDEPPALDVDFIQKVDKKSTKDDKQIDQIDSNIILDKTQPAESDLPNPSEIKIVKETPEFKTETVTTIKESDNIDKVQNDNGKSVGKLKTMNFSINVNALLPGASPKKIKRIEQIDGQAQSTKSNEDIRIKNPDAQVIESKLTKSVSFDGDPESQVLDNTLSKERAKIQVKRRPSTRRARKEAVRKSGIDFGDNNDSTDNSSSVDDSPRVTTTEDVKLHKDKNKITQEVKTKTVYILNDEDIFNTSEITSSHDIFNTSKELDKVDNEFNAKNNEETSSISTLGNVYKNDSEMKYEVESFEDDLSLFKPQTKSRDLPDNKKDIDINKNDETQTFSDDSSLFKTQNKSLNIAYGKSATDNKPTDTVDNSASIDKSVKGERKALFDDLSDDENIFNKNKKEVKKTIFDSDSDEELFFKKETTKSDTKDVMKVVKGPLFGDDDDDDDLFGVKPKKPDDSSQPSRSTAKETVSKTAEPVFEDPLSLFGTDDN